MGAHPCMPPLPLPDADAPAVEHVFEVYETGGVRYLRITFGHAIGQASGITVSLSRGQAEQLRDGAGYLANRIVD